MKNRFWFVTLAVVMILGLALTACKPAAEEAPATPAEEEAPAAEEEAAPVAEEEEAPAAEEEEAPAAEEEAEPTKVTYIDVNGFYTLDVYQTPWFTLTQGAMYDPLVTLNMDKSAYVGVLADSWDVSDDGLEVTFYLKEGVTFHDGTAWNADACKWNLDNFLDPEWPKAINETWIDTVASIEKVDDMTVKMTFHAPNATIFADLYITYFVSPTAYEEHGVDNFGMNPVGTGAFIPVEIIPNDHVLYKANPDYIWGPEFYSGEPAKVDFLEIKFIPDEAVAFAALETGEATFINLPAQFVPQASENADIVVNKGVSTTLNYLGINWTKEIYTIPEFRAALAHAIDREEIVLAAFEGEAVETAQFIPGGCAGFSTELDEYAREKWNFDPEMSNTILDELGWVDSNDDGVRERDGVELVFPFNFFTDEATGRAAEVIQGQLLDIGIMLELGPMEAAAQAEMLVAEQQEFFIRGYGYPDPVIISWMTYYPNRNALNSEEGTALATVADTTVDPVARQVAVDALNKWMIDENVFFPIWTPYNYIAYRSDLQGVIFDVSGDIFLNDAYFDN